MASNNVGRTIIQAGFNRMNKLVQISDANRTSPNHKTNRVDFLDGWRGLAISFVLLNHFFKPDYISFGRLGVDIFFVLSGLLMSNILFVKKTPLKTFYWRRFTRIYPAFFVVVSSICLVSYIFDLSEEHENYFYILTFVRTYVESAAHLWNTGIPIGHTWSLNVEEHSYIFLSFLTVVPFLSKRWHISVLLLFTGCMSIAMNFFYIYHAEIAPTAWEIRTEVVASPLLISAGYFLIRDKTAHFVESWMPLLSFILALSLYSDFTPHWAAKAIFAPLLLAFTVNHLEELPSVLLDILRLNYLRLLGVWSFSIYLWQQPFYYMVKFGEIFPGAKLFGFTLAIITGYLSFRFLEKPVREYLNDYYSDRKA